MCGKIAETLAVEYSRVTDAYGGYYNNPSPSLPKAKAATTTTKTTNTTAANKTRMLNATNATNATKAAPKQTEWKINMFVQPDPFAKTVDNSATVKAATGDNVLTAVNSVTGTAFGKLTKANMVAAAVTEAAVKWVKKPTGTKGTKQIEIGGSVDVAAYVYCGVSKTAARFRMLNATPKVYRFMKLAASITQDNYPETLWRMYIINVPMLFSAVWAIAKKFIDPKT